MLTAFGARARRAFQAPLESPHRRVRRHICHLLDRGSTQIEIEERIKIANRVASTLRGAAHRWRAARGAIALLECLPALDPMRSSGDEDERAAARIITRALQAPFAMLISNCGENRTKSTRGSNAAARVTASKCTAAR